MVTFHRWDLSAMHFNAVALRAVGWRTHSVFLAFKSVIAPTRATASSATRSPSLQMMSTTSEFGPMPFRPPVSRHDLGRPV